METKKDKSRKKATVLGTFTVMAILIFAAWTIVFHIPKPVIEPTDEGTWHVVWRGSLADAAEADPGAGASGFLGFYLLNHTASPATAYDENDSSVFETWATTAGLGYANADEFNIEITHSVALDFVFRGRGNKTNCWNGTDFIDAHCRVNLTVSGVLTISDVTGTLVVTYNDSGQNYLWYNVYLFGSIYKTN